MKILSKQTLKWKTNWKISFISFNEKGWINVRRRHFRLFKNSETDFAEKKQKQTTRINKIRFRFPSQHQLRLPDRVIIKRHLLQLLIQNYFKSSKIYFEKQETFERFKNIRLFNQRGRKTKKRWKQKVRWFLKNEIHN